MYNVIVTDVTYFLLLKLLQKKCNSLRIFMFSRVFKRIFFRKFCQKIPKSNSPGVSTVQNMHFETQIEDLLMTILQ